MFLWRKQCPAFDVCLIKLNMTVPSFSAQSNVEIVLQREEGGQVLAISTLPNLPRYPVSDDGFRSLILEDLPEDAKMALVGISYKGEKNCAYIREKHVCRAN